MTKQLRATIIWLVGLLVVFSGFNIANAENTKQVPLRIKEQFIVHIFSKIRRVNEDILTQRRHLQMLYGKLQNGKPLLPKATRWVEQLAKAYNVSTPDFLADQKTWQELFNRINVVPPSLVIAQAILQSNWGQSADARRNNDFFGMAHRDEGCGIDKVTKYYQQQDTHKHEQNATVRFRSTLAAVKDYIDSVNTNDYYVDLRRLRAQALQNKQMISGINLAAGLKHCAVHGKKYVGQIQNIIRQYNLTKYDQRLQELVKHKHHWWYF